MQRCAADLSELFTELEADSESVRSAGVGEGAPGKSVVLRGVTVQKGVGAPELVRNSLASLLGFREFIPTMEGDA